MKKLMVAVAIALAAVMSQAAQITWKQTSKDAFTWLDGTTGGGRTAYLYQLSATTADAAATESLNLYNSLASGSTAISAVTAGDGTIGSASTKTATTSRTKVDTTLTSSKLTEGKTAYYVMFMTGQNSDKKDMFIMSTVTVGKAFDPTGEIETEGSVATFSSANFSSTAETRSGWTTVAVPEPTSGLLLLLGMAGLALRRRRA